MPSITVPGSHARAVRVTAGESVQVINTHGTQVVDFWAIRADHPEIAMSMQHSRVRWRNLRPHPGDEMLDEERSVIMTMIADTSPGVHDTVIAACDRFRYEQLGAAPGHRSCCSNFDEALAELSIRRTSPVPAPLNLFMNIPWDLDGAITFEPTVSSPGDSVLFRAEIDLVAIASACPMDIVPINGPGGGTPVDVELVTSH
ncbi:MAG: urea carboxylase-associated family protein [Ilumatobacteraceae bacterium]